MKKVEIIYSENGHIKSEYFYCEAFACSDYGVSFVINGCEYAVVLSWNDMPKGFMGFSL